MEIVKNSHKFLISDIYNNYCISWFTNHYEKWEKDTFHILEHYKNHDNGVYIDIGSWIGPTVLYSANIFNKVIAIEPDPIAIERFKKNLKVNKFKNVILIEKGLSKENGIVLFGGNGKLGNSESTLLIANMEDYLSYDGRHTRVHEHNEVIEIETITIETLIKTNNINPNDISLIKMDIEGGEKLVIPALKTFLKIHMPVFYISLHRCFLREREIIDIINILFEIYQNCYIFSKIGDKISVDKQYIQDNKLCCLVFEK